MGGHAATRIESVVCVVDNAAHGNLDKGMLGFTAVQRKVCWSMEKKTCQIFREVMSGDETVRHRLQNGEMDLLYMCVHCCSNSPRQINCERRCVIDSFVQFQLLPGGVLCDADSLRLLAEDKMGSLFPVTL